ncbi:DUF1007 family protein [Rhizobium paknamense]|uniref:ABC-type uncharacterized transport system substrate-binding protein n=1 Tax=Rhizobium paknamense TaxID=1206817 RepID=A0ABU0IIM1_9HYPH|nr:DUF1007 family protein [Rhizobium paknamense]MDQ0458110.1 ABC-type uncharacterized transport system substrate-binding protein [Rhizobium paknamense]
MMRLLLATLLGGFLLPALPATAHPDIAITLRVLFNLKRGVLTGIGESLTFDAAYSATLMRLYDRNGDGHLDGMESLDLGQRLIADLGPTRYFSRLSMDGQRVARLEPADFNASVAGGIVTVTFAFNLAGSVDLRGRGVSLDIHDPDFQAAFRLAETAPLQIRGDDDGKCRTDVAADPDHRYFAGLIVPQTIRLTCGR